MLPVLREDDLWIVGLRGKRRQNLSVQFSASEGKHLAMSLSETLSTVRYLTNAQGEKIDVLVPLTTWEALLTPWKELIERLEDQEDKAILQEWLERRAKSEAGTISLDDLERELAT